MDEIDVPRLLAVVAVMLAVAKVLGGLAKRFGQPSVLGELFAGVILGESIIGLVNVRDPALHIFAELGVVILLFEIGLETDLRKLLRVGITSTTVAVAGVILPFILGYVFCRWWGLDNLVAIVVGAALTATSVGITARVLSDLGRLDEPESQIVLGAAVLDDIIGLVILTVVARMTSGVEVTPGSVATIIAVALGFLLVTLSVGTFVLPPLLKATRHVDLPGTATIAALVIALGLASLADACGSAMIIGALAAGLLLGRTPQAKEIERGVAHLGHFFVPLFFVGVGAAVDLRALNPLDVKSREMLGLGSVLIVIAIVSKFAAGYVPFWFNGRKQVIGVAMIPRGEVGLIFAQMGLATGLFTAGVFSAVAIMVMATTFVAPPLLKLLFPPLGSNRTPPEGIEELVTEA